MIAVGGDQSQTEGAGTSLDRTIVLVGTLGALAFLVVLMLALVTTGDRRVLADTITPLLVAGSGVIMLRRGHPNAALHLLIGMIGMSVWAIVGGSGIANDPIIGFLTMAIAGTLLVRAHQVAYVLIAGAAVAVTAFFTDIDGRGMAERTTRTVIALTSFMVLAWLVTWLRGQATDRQDRLEAALASKGEFVATVSHELRTPLTTIMGIAHEMRDRVGEFAPEELEEFAALLADESSDIAAIVDDLLVAARSEVGSLNLDVRSVSLAAELAAASTGFAALEIQAPAEFETMRVPADPGRTRQILRNLLVNAQRYGGPEVRVVAVVTDSEAIIEVRDTGRPIPMAEREQIFEAFQRSTTSTTNPESVGLGLTVSRRLARLMKGDVAYDHDGTEAIFVLKLPLDRSQPAQVAQQAVA